MIQKISLQVFSKSVNGIIIILTDMVRERRINVNERFFMNMYLASEGYLWEKSQQGRLNADEVEKDFIKMIDFWKQIYLRKE